MTDLGKELKLDKAIYIYRWQCTFSLARGCLDLSLQIIYYAYILSLISKENKKYKYMTLKGVASRPEL